MSEEEPKYKTAKELKEEQEAKNQVDLFEDEIANKRLAGMTTEPLTTRYLNTLPFALTKQEVIQAETEWFQIQVAKQKLLNQAKKELLESKDGKPSPYYQKIGAKDFVIKSGVRILMSAFGISITDVTYNIIEREWLEAPPLYVAQIGKKEIIVIAQAKAVRKITVSKNGVTAEIVIQEMMATGSFSSREQMIDKHQPYKFHNLIATAETRAKSRAALDMLSGDVSFDEI